MEGAKAGSGKARSAVIQDDSASSITDANVVYGLCEGEIAGLANGQKSIRLDGTPIENSLGEKNFEDVQVEFKTGTLNQEPLLGFPNVVSQVDYNNIEVTTEKSFVHHINDTQFTSANVRIVFGAIFKTNSSNGDTDGNTVEYAIDIQVDGLGWNEYSKYVISDKTSANYERGHPIELPEAEESWDIRVRRITPNQNSQYIGDKMYVASVAQIINARFSYPYTALIGIKYNASRFSSVAKLAIRLKGKIIRIPTNMNPVTGEYATTGAGTTNGMWDGSFKWEYSNNPAWVYYDICLNKRYGLGNRITADKLDKWSLYTIGKYCDEKVPDGFGGEEKRFTVNVYISSFYDAHDCLLQLSGVFRGILYYNGTQLRMEMDRPRDPVYTYNLSNVIGKFSYKSSKEKDRFSVITVEYDDPELEYKTVPMTVFDRNAMRQIGVKTKKIQAFGCTSRGQAQRVAYWLLYKNLFETRSVTFKVGLEGFIAPTGRIIEIADQKFAGRANGGRVSEVSADKKTITIDRDAGKVGDRLVINGEDGFSESREVTAVNGRLLTVSIPFDNVAEENAFALDSDDLALMRFTVVTASMDQSDNSNAFTISAVQHSPEIFDKAEFGVFLDQRPITVINPDIQDPVTDLVIQTETKVIQGLSVTSLVITWTQAKNAVKYAVQYQKDDGQWINAPDNYSNTCIVEDVYSGIYTARVVAINVADVRSKATVSAPTQIIAKFTAPPVLAKFSATGILFGVTLNFDFLAGSQNAAYTEIQVSVTPTHSDASTLTLVPYPQKDYTYTGLSSGATFHYRARLVDRNGFDGPWTAWITAKVIDDPDQILGLIEGHIGIKELDEELQKEIESIKDVTVDLSEIRETAENAKVVANNAQASATDAKNQANAANVAITKEVADRKADTLALQQSLSKEVSKLNDGITQEATVRRQGDEAQTAALNAYKTSNDTFVASVANKADTAVSASEANAKNITLVSAAVNTKNRTYRQGTAPNVGLVVGDIWINTSDTNNSQRRWDGNTWVDITDQRIPATVNGLTATNATVKEQGTKLDTAVENVSRIDTTVGKLGESVTANNVAIDVLKATTTKQGNDISSVVSRTTSLENKVSSLEGTTSATNTAIQGINNNLTLLDGRVTANTNATTALSTKVTTVEQSVAKKLDADVIVNYYTKVQTDQVVAGAVAEYNASLVIGTTNLLKNSKKELSSTAYNIGFFEATRDLVAGETLTVTVKGTISTAKRFGVWLNAGGIATGNLVANSDGTFSNTFKVPSGVTSRIVGLYLVNNQAGTDAWTFEWIMLEVGNKRSDWKPASADADATMASQANLIQATSAKVDIVDGRVTANTNAILSMNSRVTNVEQSVATKLDASVINSYSTTTQMNTAIATGISQYDAKLSIGGSNVLLNSEGERTSQAASQREYLMYERSAAIKAFYDENLGKQVTVSFEIKVPVAGTIQVYTSNDSAHNGQVTTSSIPADTWTKVAVQFIPTKSSTPDKTWSTLEFYGIYGSGRIPTVRKVQLEAGNKATAWAPSPRDYKAADEANAQAITVTQAKVDTQEGKISALTTQYTSLNAKVDTNQSNLQVNYYTKAQSDSAITAATTTLDSKFTGQINSVNSRVDNIKLDRTTIPDTRDVNQPPSWYWANYKRSVVPEFKSSAVIGLVGYGNFVTMVTTVPWDDASGGNIQQVATNGDGILTATRYSVSTTAWSEWKRVGKDNQDAIVTLTSNVTNNYYTKAAADSAIANATTGVKAQLGSTVFYQVVTGRNGGGSLPNRAKGWYDAQGNVSNAIQRGLNLVTFGADGKIDSNTQYDTYADTNNQCELLNNALNTLAANKYFAIVGYDNLGAVGTSQDPRAIALRNTLYACGATSEYLGAWSSTQIPFFVSRKGAALYNTRSELFLSGTNNDGVAYDLIVVNGVPNGLGNSAYYDYIQSATSSAVSSLTSQVSTLNGQVIAQGNAITQTKAELTTAIQDAANGKYYQLDLSGLDANTWYPVTLASKDQGSIARIEVRVPLSKYTAPWATHASQTFSVTAAWTDQASGWGAQPIERVIEKFGFLWSAISPVANISQMTNSSVFYCLVRGGTKYDMYVTNANAPVIRTATYTVSGQTITPIANTANLVIPKSLNAMALNTATATSELDSKVSSVDGRVTALSTQTNNIQTTVNGQTVTIQQQAQSIDGIQGKYTIKINNNGYMTGYGIISTMNNGVPVSAFMVDADAFVVGKAGTNIKPIVAVVAGQTVEGVYYPESGTYLNSAWIAKASIKLAHIDVATIDSLSSLSANLGTIQVGTANIADLSVDTIKIKDNAVTSLIDIRKAPEGVESIFPAMSAGNPQTLLLKSVIATGLNPRNRYLVYWRGIINLNISNKNSSGYSGESAKIIYFGSTSSTSIVGSLEIGSKYASGAYYNHGAVIVGDEKQWNIAEGIVDETGSLCIWASARWNQSAQSTAANSLYAYLSVNSLVVLISEFKK